MASKTAELRKIIVSKLAGIGGQTYYRTAPPSASYPYKVFDLRTIDLGSLTRNDFVLEVNVYTKAYNSMACDEIADSVERALTNDGGYLNAPSTAVLPTFFPSNRYSSVEEDRDIQCATLNFSVQLYER